MKIKILLFSILVFNTTLFAQDNYAVIISEQFAFDDARAIDEHWIKTFNEWHKMVYTQNIPIDNVYVFFCDGKDYQHPGMPDKYNPKMYCMCRITNYPAKTETIKNFFQVTNETAWHSYDYPKINKADSLYVAIIRYKHTNTTDSIMLLNEPPIVKTELLKIIDNRNLNTKIIIK